MRIKLHKLWSQWLIGLAWEDALVRSMDNTIWCAWIYLGPFSLSIRKRT